MKTRKILGVVIALALMICAFAAISTVSAQECIWTLYVNGQPYSSSASYAVSGQLKYYGGVVHMNNFNGQTIEAVPGGFYGDDDAPVLNIEVVGNCTLTGGVLDDGTFGAIYCEPRAGGSGDNSRINISGSGTLNIQKVDSSYNRSDSNVKAYKAIYADELITDGTFDLNISTTLYGVGESDKSVGVCGIYTKGFLSLSNKGKNNIKISVGKSYVAHGGGFSTEYDSYVKVVGIYSEKARLGNGIGYTSVDISNMNTAASYAANYALLSSDVMVSDYRYALYFNAGAGRCSDVKNVVNLTKFHVNDGKINYTAYIPADNEYNSHIKCIDLKNIISDPKIYNVGDTKPANDTTFYPINGALVKKNIYEIDSIDSSVTKDFTKFENGKCYRYQFRLLPAPGYWIPTEAYDLLKTTFVKDCKVRVTPDKATYSPSLTGDYELRYHYSVPVITKQPVNVTAGARDKFSFAVTATGENITYKWYRDTVEGIKKPITSSDGSVTGQNTAAFSFDPKVVSENFANCGYNGNKFYCVITSPFGTVETDKAVLTVLHQPTSEEAKLCEDDNDYHYTICYCDEKIKSAHSLQTDPGTPATFTEKGISEGKHCSDCGAVINAQKIVYNASTVKLSATSFTYNGKIQKPTLVVKTSQDKTISTKYYTAKWSNSSSKSVGTYTVKITFKGNYSGTKTLTYKILPKQVTGLKASTVKTTSIKLTWTKVTGAKYYKVEQSTDGKTWKAIKTASTNALTVSSLTAGKKYQFRVTALDSTKKLSGKVSAVLKTGTLTAAPTVTLTSSKSKTAVASWKKVTGASKYVVYKSTDGKKFTKVTETAKLTYTLKKLTGGKKIYVKVTAVNAYGNASAYSSAKSVTVKK